MQAEKMTQCAPLVTCQLHQFLDWFKLIFRGDQVCWTAWWPKILNTNNSVPPFKIYSDFAKDKCKSPFLCIFKMFRQDSLSTKIQTAHFNHKSFSLISIYVENNLPTVLPVCLCRSSGFSIRKSHSSDGLTIFHRTFWSSLWKGILMGSHICCRAVFLLVISSASDFVYNTLQMFRRAALHFH